MPINTNLLKPGTKIELATGRSAIVIKRIGKGSQGEVYLAMLDGEQVCLKIFTPGGGTTVAQRRLLPRYAAAGRPSKYLVDLFDIVPSQFADVPAGYVMELVDLSKLKGVNSLVRYTKLPPLSHLVDLGIIFSLGQRQLHAAGYRYCDYSPGNIKWNFDDEVLFRQLDLDNLMPQGVSLRILGTSGYIAPEVAKNNKPPSVLSDSFGISVCLFQLVAGGGMHPLYGKAALRHPIQTDNTRKLLETINPCFVYDPEKKWNRPSRTHHGRLIYCWHSIPKYLKDLFIQAFTLGLHEPEKRVTDTQWLNAFVKLRGLIEKCPKCKEERFLEPSVNGQSATHTTCLKCKGSYAISPRLTFGAHSEVVLTDGATLLSSQAGTTKATARGGIDPIAAVSAVPGKQGLVALENTSRKPWIVQSNGRKSKVAPRKKVLLTANTRIHFLDASVEGVIHFP